MQDGIRGKPVEQAFVAAQFGEHHHTDQEQVDVRSFTNRRPSIGSGNQRKEHEHCRTEHRPGRFGHFPRPDDDPENRDGDDDPRCKVGR